VVALTTTGPAALVKYGGAGGRARQARLAHSGNAPARPI
jgi:hypothetical protein